MTQLDYKELNDSFVPGGVTSFFVHNEHDESYGWLTSIEPVNKETIEKYGFCEYDFTKEQLEVRRCSRLCVTQTDKLLWY